MSLMKPVEGIDDLVGDVEPETVLEQLDDNFVKFDEGDEEEEEKGEVEKNSLSTEHQLLGKITDKL